MDIITIKDKISEMLKAYVLEEKVKILNYSILGDLPPNEKNDIEKVRLYDEFALKIKNIVNNDTNKIKIMIKYYYREDKFMQIWLNIKNFWYGYIILILFSILTALYFLFIITSLISGILYKIIDSKNAISFDRILAYSLIPGLNITMPIMYVAMYWEMNYGNK